MIERRLHQYLHSLLQSNAAVVLVGPRQIGKTTLALKVTDSIKGVYRDLEDPRDADQVRDIILFAEQYPNQLIILDEIQRLPNLFAPLRVIIDQRRRTGQPYGQFLFLGSASLDLLGQTSESLAGRVAHAELVGINVLELEKTKQSLGTLWLRGGFPESLLSPNDNTSIQWRGDLIRSYLERDIPQFGFRIPAETLRRFWTMLAHHQGGLLNAAQLAASLGVSGQSIARYLDILVDLLLVRRLQPWFANVGKRLVKSPKIYIRDSGILHALLGLSSKEQLLSHPVLGASWEGFAIENLVNVCKDYQPYFYRTSAGAEIDLILVRGGKPVIAIEVKRASAPKLKKGFYLACSDLGITNKYIVYPGQKSYTLPENIQVIPLLELMRILQDDEL
ncbi:MAG: ATP-binding protein [Xanthomonadales bacterium]|nr:ATP-binding protein [Xanthomonadales bacterium]